MTTRDRWLGIHLLNHGEMAMAQILDLIVRAEKFGFNGVTVNEDVGYDAFALLAVAASKTSKIGLGTAIVNVYPRSAMQIAMGAATVDDLSGGRFALGLSVGHPPWNDLYHGIPLEKAPLSRVREYVEFIHGVLSGGLYHHDGTLYKGVETHLIGNFRQSTVPIYIGGERGGMLRTAGQVADGAIMNVVSADYIANFAADRFFSSAKDAGRDPKTLDLTVMVTCCLNKEREKALALARTAFVRRVSVSPQKMTDMRTGKEKEELLRICELIDAGEQAKAIQEISESLVTSTFAVGDADDIRQAVERFYDAGATRVLLSTSPTDAVSFSELMSAMAPK